MNSVITCMGLLLSMVSCMFGQSVSATIDTTTNHWGEGGNVASPVILPDEAVGVLAGTTLTIEPGTKVLASGANSSLFVSGRLVANGTSGAPIVFSSSEVEPGALDWQGLDFDSCEPSRLTFVRISDARTGVSIRYGSVCTLSNSIITNYYDAGVTLSSTDEKVAILNCTVTPIPGSPDADCISLTMNNGSPTIQNNILGAFSVKSLASVACALGSSHAPRIRYNLLISEHGIFACTYSPDDGNLSVTDPQFIDEANGDFRLRPTSPAVDAGDPLSDYSQEPSCDGANTRIDMGAYGNTPEAPCRQEQPVARRVSRMGHGEAFTVDVLYDVNGRLVWRGEEARAPRMPRRPAGVYVGSGSGRSCRFVAPR